MIEVVVPDPPSIGERSEPHYRHASRASQAADMRNEPWARELGQGLQYASEACPSELSVLSLAFRPLHRKERDLLVELVGQLLELGG